MKIIAILLLLLIPVAYSQLVIDFSEPEIQEISIRQSEEGILCNVKTNNGSWPLFKWQVNGKDLKEEGQLLTSGYNSGDDITCSVIATTGYLNVSSSQTINAMGSAPPITGAIIGAVGSNIGIGGIVIAFFLLAGLVYVNYRMYVRHRDNVRKRKYLE